MDAKKPKLDTCETEHLRLDPDDGRVFLKAEDGDEFVGHIDDLDSCPHGHWDEWERLHGEWCDRVAFGEACRRTAEWSYYDRLGVPGRN